jgi:hypothetical protein
MTRRLRIDFAFDVELPALGRRVTICRIVDVESGAVVAEGLERCANRDRVSKELGKEFAQLAALRRLERVA